MADQWSSSPDVHLGWSPGEGRTGLADAIRTAIRDGRWRPGAPVPSTRALAHDLGIARGTVTRVYTDLAAEGYLLISQGAPTRVATAVARPQPPPRRPPGTPESRWTLRPGRPDLSTFPRDAWSSATRRVLQRAPADLFGYSEPYGTLALREALARYLGRSRGVLADPGRILICAGFTHAISVLSHALLDLGSRELAFEDPSMWMFRDIVAAAGQLVVGVPVDDDGLQVSKVDSPAVMVTPAHHYPLGVTMAPSRRTALVKSGTMIIEDDYDGEFRFDRQQVGALQALAPERVVYAGTASKTLAPALRLSWLVLPQSLIDPVFAAFSASGARPSAVDQLILAELLESGAYDQHVRRCRTEYRRRRDQVVAALPDHLAVQGISAGLQLVVRLPCEDEVLAEARRRSLDLETLGPHWIDQGEREGGIIVGYGAPAKHAFSGTLATLVEVLAAVT
ncbi:GntR family transcriptional regulator / MocR family aminotransferase [Amycolatopsis xylanica]|uniref:GntR family transcriptional regulator / MocR family aminotransferase n=1 Tax=Amycolatopsis xylanica TaxID=589385 RepID=A0A1H3QR19_9PSEU|nr:PLP-dependent aminotransferase family protein [Amycolatopsis xylanica]SDZ15445.1 GntR family transcriptional regulator / MocR family aminotransferase [Amycolatopsis xylanica]